MHTQASTFLLRCFFLLLLGSGYSCALVAQDSVEAPRRAPIFESTDVLSIRIEANFKSLLKDIGDEREYHPAVLKYADKQGDTVILPLKIMARGNFRRKITTCNFPPIKLNFKKKTTPGTVFEGQDKMKLVTHCQNKKDVYEQYLLEEYLIYRCYNLFSEESFNVRLMEVTYVDSMGKWGPYTKPGFVIEDIDHVAERCGGIELGPRNIHPDDTDYEKVNLLSIFFYMIGNTDFSVAHQHNVKLISTSESSPPVAVPYDFDWSGLISPPYARPSEQLPINSVRERLFRGFCRTPEEFEAAFQSFRDNKEAIYALFQNQDGLEPKVRDKALKYLDQFYETINDPKKVKREFYNACRTDK